MIWVIVIPILLAIIIPLAYTKWDPYWDGFNIGCCILCGLVFGVCAGLFIALDRYDPITKEVTWDVVAAKDGSSVEGRFSIFAGYIDEDPYYFYYQQGADGGIRQGKIPAEGTVIYEDQESRSFIQKNTCPTEWRFWGRTGGCYTTYEIHVPKGSVKRDVEFDLE